MRTEHLQRFLTDWLKVRHDVKFTADGELLIQEVEEFIPNNAPCLVALLKPRVWKVDRDEGDTGIVYKLP